MAVAAGFDDFDDFFGRYREFLRPYLAALVSKQLADDLMQECFTEIARHWREESSPPLPSDLVNSVQRQTKDALSWHTKIAILLIWLAAVCLPVIATQLPAKDHALFQDWIATCALAVGLVPIVKAKASPKNNQ